MLYGRYHLHVLRTAREVRNALAYVLLNARKHWKQPTRRTPPVRLEGPDEASSGFWFEGWRKPHRGPTPGGLPEVSDPHTWLLRRGWRRYGLIDPAEVPGLG